MTRHMQLRLISSQTRKYSTRLQNILLQTAGFLGDEWKCFFSHYIITKVHFFSNERKRKVNMLLAVAPRETSSTGRAGPRDGSRDEDREGVKRGGRCERTI